TMAMPRRRWTSWPGWTRWASLARYSAAPPWARRSPCGWPTPLARAVAAASLGAALSLWLAAHHASRVRGVFSISGPPYAPPEEDRRWWAAHRPLVAAGRFDEYLDANVRLRMGEEALARLKARPERYAELTEGLRRHSVASLLALLDETYSRPEWLADCARIRCPVQIVAGERDHFPTVEMSRRLAATIPGTRPHVGGGGRGGLQRG